ncbi:MAG: NUDIX domain-containing protein [Paracoccaceae bacterium]
MNLFLYGTLRHIPLLEIVLGRTAEGYTVNDDELSDFSVAQVVNGDFPALISAPGETAKGLLVSGLTQDALARLNFYEGGFDYELQERTLTSGMSAMVYLPPTSIVTNEFAWDFHGWEDHWAPIICEAAHEAMSLFGKVSADELTAVFPRIRTRAQSRLNAKRDYQDPETLRGRIDIEFRRRAYSGFYALDEVRLSHETFNGKMSAPIDRAVFITTDAALVLPYDPIRDRVLLVEQIRMGPLARGDSVLWHLEPVAGLIDPGEKPHETAIREAKEEAGLELSQLEPVSEGYLSPGGSTDYQYLYVGVCDLPGEAARLGGLEAEGEDIRAHLMPFDDLLARADACKITNAPLTLITHWLARHRDRLRSA